jgi:hypothetical protein
MAPPAALVLRGVNVSRRLCKITAGLSLLDVRLDELGQLKKPVTSASYLSTFILRRQRFHSERNMLFRSAVRVKKEPNRWRNSPKLRR